jgi:hypothetical protein
MKIASFDIETFPIQAYTWGPKWEANLIKITEHVKLAGFSYKPLGKAVKVYGAPDFKSYEDMVTALWEVFDEYDVLIAHNGKQFDIKQSNVFFIDVGLAPPSPYHILDTKLVAKRYFRFPSNSLNDLSDFFKVGQKLDTGGANLWFDCMAGKPEAWAKMKKYNRQDVILLEAIYLKMRPWMTNHPNFQAKSRQEAHCPNCTGSDFQKRGYGVNRKGKYPRYQCACGAWFSGPVDNSPGTSKIVKCKSPYSSKEVVLQK